MFSSNKVICENCGTVGYPKQGIRGSFILEVFLWIIFLIPGILYSIYRRIGVGKVCKRCKSSDLVPVDSPRGKKLLEK